MKKYILFLVLMSSALISEQKEHQSLMATLFVQNSAESYTNSMSIYKAAVDQLEKVVEKMSHHPAICFQIEKRGSAETSSNRFKHFTMEANFRSNYCYFFYSNFSCIK